MLFLLERALREDRWQSKPLPKALPGLRYFFVFKRDEKDPAGSTHLFITGQEKRPGRTDQVEGPTYLHISLSLVLRLFLSNVKLLLPHAAYSACLVMVVILPLRLEDPDLL